MGTGYTRNDTSNNIADGNVINASDLDGEFDAVVSAFNASTGHTHDGTAAEGAPVTVVGPAQDFVVSATEIKPKTTNTLDIGTSALQFKNLYVDGTGYIDAVDIDGGNIDGTTIGASSAAAITGTTITGTSFVTSGDMTFGDNDKAIFGAGSDLQIYHDGGNSVIKDAGTGGLFLMGSSNVYITNNGASANFFAATEGAEVRLFYNNSAKLATTSTGISVTGNMVVSGTVDGRDVATDGTKLDGIESNATADQTAGEILTALKTVDGSGSGLDADQLDGLSSGSFLRSDAADSKTSGDLTFSDSIKAVFGSGSDLQIYHNGSNSYIDEGGTGSLFIRSNDVSIDKYTGESMISATADGAVELYYDNAKKIETTSGGVSITGNITVSGTVDGRDVATDGTKLDGIESNATADQSAAEILTAIKTVDGAGSGLDADTLDGSHASAFLTGNQTITLSGDVTGSGTTSISTNIAANVVGASELNVTGNGTTSQFLRSDGDGTFTWATPTDTNTTYTAGGDYGMTLSGTEFRLEDDRRRNSTTADIYSGNTNDYTFYDADVGIRWYTAGAEDMRLTDAGDLHVDGNVTAYSTTISDKRLKENIIPVDSALDKIQKLTGYNFTYKNSGRKSAGVLAQDVESVMPSAVQETELPLEIADGKKYKTVQYDQLHALLIEAVKELAAKVERLENGSSK